MNVKRVAGASVIVECGRKLGVKALGKVKPRANLPCKQERIVIWDFLRWAVCVRSLSGPKRILRIRIVINELAEVRTEIDLQEWLRRLRGPNGFGILAERGRRRA